MKRYRKWLVLINSLAMVATVSLAFASSVFAGTVSTGSGFEGADGNLAVDSTFDWNGFAPVNYLPSPSTTPTRTADKTVNGFVFKGLEDWAATTSDNGFAGGTKQDKDCASVIGTKSPNKDDLKRIYIAHNVGTNGHLYLELGWVRIPQNTTSPSAHVGFEFNQGTTPCQSPTNPGGLVQRTAGDLLIVYDFAGSTTDNPILTVRKWVTSGTCEISSDSAPCWGVAQDLTASGFAEAKVNTLSTASDALTPPALTSSTGTSVTSTLGLNEFGEAVIDLTGASIFTSNVCTSFGQAEGVSRSSGNSGQAAMEDLVGPGHISITNCGTLIVKKVTDPSPDPTSQSFGFSVNGPNPPNSGGSSGAASLPKTFSLTNGQTNSSTVFGGFTYSATETIPANWALTGATCDNGSGTVNTSTGVLSGITVATGETVTCTFNDKLQEGAISIHKVDTKGNVVAGASFTATASDGTTVYNFPNTDTSGNACVANLPFDTYTVAETAAPTGYAKDANSQSVTVSTAGTCASGATAAGSNFVDTPLSDIQVNFRDGGSGKTSATISCNNTTGTGSNTAATGWDTSRTVTGISAPTTVVCTITIDP